MSKPGDRDPELSDEYDFSRAKRGVHHASTSRGIRVHLVTDEADQTRQAADRDSAATPKPRPKRA